ncbi:MAG: hypothetical protein ACK5JT_06450 [Hyphomicrobiaceae bacterium]
MLATSPSSPVMTALLSLSGMLAERGLGARIVLAGGAIAAANETWNLVFSAGFDHEIRLTTNPRILDGHEQLIIGDRSFWFGDCMRRNPGKIDAFEMYKTDVRDQVRAARNAFGHLWDGAQPVYTSPSIAEVSRERLPANQKSRKQTASWRLSADGSAVEGDQQMRVTSRTDLLETLRAWRPLIRH